MLLNDANERLFEHCLLIVLPVTAAADLLETNPILIWGRKVTALAVAARSVASAVDRFLSMQAKHVANHI